MTYGSLRCHVCNNTAHFLTTSEGIVCALCNTRIGRKY